MVVLSSNVFKLFITIAGVPSLVGFSSTFQHVSHKNLKRIEVLHGSHVAWQEQ